MPGTDALDDASDDHERFEAELIAQDQDAARVAVADIDERRAHSLVNDLVDADVVEVTQDEQPRRYAARAIDLTVTTATGDRKYTITPALIDAVGRRETNADIDIYIDRHGVAGLATALTYAVARERGEVTHRLMTEDLDISPLAAEMILQALRPVVHEHYDFEEAGTGLGELDIGDGTDDT